MPGTKDRRKLQALYPEPKKHSGMTARKPTSFTIPVVRLSSLLFLPPYAILAISSIYSWYVYGGFEARVIYFFLFLASVIITAVVGLVLLVNAYRILVRSCLQAHAIGVTYVACAVGIVWVFISQYHALFLNDSIGRILTIEAVVLAAIIIPLTLLARLLSY